MKSSMGSGQSITIAGTLLISLVFWLAFDARSALDPMSLALTPDDATQYLNGWPSGTGIRETAAFLKSLAGRTDRPVLVLAGGFGCHGLWTLPMLTAGSRNLEYRRFPISNRTQMRQAIDEASQRTVVIISERTNCELSAEVSAAVRPVLRPVFTFDRPESPADIDVYQLEAASMLRPDQQEALPELGAAEDARLVSVDDPNGLEKMGGADFFWMGQGSTVLRIASARSGALTLQGLFHFGPSFGSTVRYLVRSSAGGSFELPIGSGNGSFDVNVEAGWSEVILSPIDRPRNLNLSNGDRRPLMTGVQGLRIAKLTAAAAPAVGCALSFGEGWHAIEKAPDAWLRWSTGQGVIWITVPAAQSAQLTGEVNSLPVPNRVRIELNETPVGDIEIDAKSGGTTPLGTLTLPLRPGRNRLEILSQKPAGTAPNDPRKLAVALRNARVLVSRQATCPIQF